MTNNNTEQTHYNPVRSGLVVLGSIAVILLVVLPWVNKQRSRLIKEQPETEINQPVETVSETKPETKPEKEEPTEPKVETINPYYGLPHSYSPRYQEDKPDYSQLDPNVRSCLETDAITDKTFCYGLLPKNTQTVCFFGFCRTTDTPQSSTPSNPSIQYPQSQPSPIYPGGGYRGGSGDQKKYPTPDNQIPVRPQPDIIIRNRTEYLRCHDNWLFGDCNPEWAAPLSAIAGIFALIYIPFKYGKDD